MGGSSCFPCAENQGGGGDAGETKRVWGTRLFLGTQEAVGEGERGGSTYPNHRSKGGQKLRTGTGVDVHAHSWRVALVVGGEKNRGRERKQHRFFQGGVRTRIA